MRPTAVARREARTVVRAEYFIETLVMGCREARRRMHREDGELAWESRVELQPEIGRWERSLPVHAARVHRTPVLAFRQGSQDSFR